MNAKTLSYKHLQYHRQISEMLFDHAAYFLLQFARDRQIIRSMRIINQVPIIATELDRSKKQFYFFVASV